MDERPTVVVVSASEGIRAQLRLTLGDERFEVVEAHDARGAAGAVATHLPALIVLDAALPNTGATGFATSLRAQPETSAIKTLVLVPRDDQERAMPESVDATIAMPATSFALLRRIEALLED